MIFKAGERTVVWESSTNHKILVFIIETEPTRALIEFGPSRERHSKWITYDKLTRRDNGRPVTYAMIVDWEINP